MTEDWHFYEPVNGHGLAHDPLNAIVAPRPIGWIGSRSDAGVNNLAPYSFFNLFNYRPPLIGFSSQGWKDSVANIAETKVFTWNLATMALAEPMNASAAMVGPEVDEFALAGLAMEEGTLVAAPRVAASPVSFECRLTQLIRLETKEGRELDQWLVIGEAGALAPARLQRVLRELKQPPAGALKIKGETLKARRGVLAASVRQEQAAAASADTSIFVTPEHLEWPFEGEYWRDELGSYRYDISSRCGVEAP